MSKITDDIEKLEKLFAEVKSLRKVALAAQEAERRFMAIDDGFFTGLVPPEFGDVSMALREWKELIDEDQTNS